MSNSEEACFAKASTLVNRLNEMIEKHGDQSIVVIDDDTQCVMDIGVIEEDGMFLITTDYYVDPKGML